MINILAVLRLTYLFTQEKGPFEIFTRLRSYFGLEDGTDEKLRFISDNDNAVYRTIGDILECPWCASMWMAFVVVSLNKIKGVRLLVPALGYSMAAIILIELFERLKTWLAVHAVKEK